mmetsp:Transcript_39639/g.90721  ORF Transcript_39639/g.90721 Transcript_39639/m.90721 type:complete len:256 (+) Transcript_39639:1121-1888(+)
MELMTRSATISPVLPVLPDIRPAPRSTATTRRSGPTPTTAPSPPAAPAPTSATTTAPPRPGWSGPTRSSSPTSWRRTRPPSPPSGPPTAARSRRLAPGGSCSTTWMLPGPTPATTSPSRTGLAPRCPLGLRTPRPSCRTLLASSSGSARSTVRIAPSISFVTSTPTARSSPLASWPRGASRTSSPLFEPPTPGTLWSRRRRRSVRTGVFTPRSSPPWSARRPSLPVLSGSGPRRSTETSPAPSGWSSGPRGRRTS